MSPVHAAHIRPGGDLALVRQQHARHRHDQDHDAGKHTDAQVAPEEDGAKQLHRRVVRDTRTVRGAPGRMLLLPCEVL